MAHFQSALLKILCPVLLFLLPFTLCGQTGTEPRQIEAVDTLTTGQALPSYEDWIMVSQLDTIGITDYRYQHSRLALPHLFLTIDDSICFVLYEGGDTSCIYVPPGMGVSDTTYQWVLQVNGGGNDTISVNEVVNLVAGTNISITQGATDITINGLVDTCIHTLTQLTDSTAALLDCNGVNRGTITFSSDECLQDMVTVNGIGSDTIFLTDCAGVKKDTVVFFPPAFNDSYIDSTRYEYGEDTLTIWLLRRDTSGIIDSLPLYVPLDSIAKQTLTYTFTGQFDTIGITNGNEIYLFDQDSQSLSIIDDTLYITRGNNVDLKPYLDNDTIPDYDFLIIGSDRVPDQPGDIDSSIYTGTGTSKRVRIGQDSIGENSAAVLGINGGLVPFWTISNITNLWRQQQRDDSVAWDKVQNANQLYFRYADLHQATLGSGIFLLMDGLYTGDSTLMIIENGSIGWRQYPNYRNDGDPPDSLKNIYYPDDMGHIKMMPIDSAKIALASSDYDFVKLQGDTLRTNMIDHVPLDSLDNDSLIFRAGVVRLGDDGFRPSRYFNGSSYDNFILDQDSAVMGLQIYGKRSAIDIYNDNTPYQHFRSQLGEFWQRIYDPTGETGLEPQRWEFGAVGKYYNEISETYDTTSRAILTISDASDALSLNIINDYIQSDIYGVHSRTRDTIVTDSVFAVMSTDDMGNFVLIPIDTIANKLGVIAAGSVEIDTFFLNDNDSLGLDLTGTVGGIQYVDLTSLKTTISNDTLYQGDTFYLLPSGADSLGVDIPTGEVVFSAGGKEPTSHEDFTVTEIAGILFHTFGDQLFLGSPDLRDVSMTFGNTKSGNFNSNIKMFSASTSTYPSNFAELKRASGPTGVLTLVNNAGNTILGSSNGSVSLQSTSNSVWVVNNSGSLQAPTYTSGISFADSDDVGVFGFDASGNVQGMDSTDLANFVGLSAPGVDKFINSASFNTSDGIITMPYNTTGSVTVDLDGRYQLAGSYDNYQYWRIGCFGCTGGTIQNVTSTGTFYLNEGAGVTLVQGASPASGITINADDVSNTNELQTLTAGTRTSSVYPFNLSAGGGTINIPVFNASQAGLVPGTSGGSTSVFLRGDGTWAAPSGSGGGIYGGSGTVPTTTRATLTDNFYFRSEAIDKLAIGSGGVTLRNIDGGSVYVGDNGNEWQFYYNSGDGTNRMKNRLASTSSYFWNAISGGNIGMQTGGSAQVVGGNVAISSTSGVVNLNATSTIDITAGGAITLDGTTTTIDDDAFIGANSSDQLKVETSGTAAFLSHEGAAFSNTIELNQSGEIFIGGGSGNSFQDVLRLYGNLTVGLIAAGTNASATIAIANGSAPTSSPLNGVQLYSQDVSSSAELRVRDEASNVTTLSPHNFSEIPEGPSEEMAWSFYSERDGQYVNVDMLKLCRLVEQLTGEKLVYTGKTKK